MDTTKTKNQEDFKITGNWEHQSKELKTKYSQLTDEDLKFEPGKENELLSRVQSRLKKNRIEAITLIRAAQPDKK
jgi:hypothetical protein